LIYTSRGKVTKKARVLLELRAQGSVAFGTSRLKVTVMGVIVFRLFGNFSLENFPFGFRFGYFEV